MDRFRSFRLASLGALVVLFVVGRPAAAHDEDEQKNPIIRRAFADTVAELLTIEGSHFGRRPPRVKLAEAELALVSSSGEEIVAVLPADLQPGSYLLTVAKGRERGGHDRNGQGERSEWNDHAATFDVTIGAVGPEGPMGPTGLTGPTGAMGPQGFTGPAGPTGPTGAQGAAGSPGARGPAGPPGPPGNGGSAPEDPNPLNLSMFLQVEGTKGDSKDKAHKDWSDVDGYTHGVHVPASPIGPSGPPNHDPLLVLKPADSASPFLFDHAAKGDVLRNVRLEVCRPGKAPLCFLRIDLTDAFVGSYVQNDSEETLTFTYAAIEWRYTAFGRDLKKDGELSVKWDTQLRLLTSGGSAGASAAVGYGGGDGRSFLTMKAATGKVEGEATFKPLPRAMGLSGFTRTLSGTQVLKGTDVATPILLALLHRGVGVQEATMHSGCLNQKPVGCASSFQDKDALLTELTYGASQVEHLSWLLIRRDLQ